MDESPTDNGADTTTSGSDEPVLGENQQTPSADEQSTDAVSSGETPDQQSDTEPQDGTTQDDGSSDDEDGLSNFAKAQGFDPENLTDGERKALKLAHENQKAFRKTQQTQSDKSKDAIKEVNTLEDEELDELDPEDARFAQYEARQARLESDLKLSEFYRSNNEASDYDTEMAQIVLEEAERNGKAAARYLSSDFNRLLVLAKAKRGENDSSKIADQARLDEREKLRKRQEASADTSHASNSHQSSPKVTKEWIDKEYDPSKPEHRDMVDEAIASGSLY